MNIDEASKRYMIPMEVLREYEQMGLCGSVRQVMGAWEYDERDLERLSMIMTLHDVGFTSEETEHFMRLLLAGDETESERMRMLAAHRTATLDEVHLKEKQLERIDYLRHKLCPNGCKGCCGAKERQ